MSILDEYVTSIPSNQNILDIFKGEWSSRFPAKYGLVTEPGVAPLFEDGRVIWTEQIFGSVAGWNILELGPLEGGHSYMFQERKAKRVIAVEANTRAFLKCLCTKEVLKMDRVEFMLGDFMPYLELIDRKFDLIFASGVLYHMKEPIKLLELIAKAADRVFLWTHYFDQATVLANTELAGKFGPIRNIEYKGMVYEGASQYYQNALSWTGFCGGSQPDSVWLTKESILRALRQFGYSEININFDSPDHKHGPSFGVCASR